MFKYLVFVCVIAVAFAEPGVLTPSLNIGVAPSVGIVRTVPIALGARIGAPLALSSGLVSNGLINNGLITSRLSGGLLSGKVLSGGLVSGGLIN